MAYSVNWYIENELIYSHYSGVVTAEELRQCLVKMQDMIESSPRHLVHIISDVGDITEGVPLKDAVRIVREVGSHPRSGWSISIREQSVLMKLGSAVGTSIFRMRYKTCDTLEQALDFLRTMDEALNWDRVNKSVAEHPGG